MRHAIGAVAAVVAVLVLGAAADPSPMAGGSLTGARAAATILALPLAIALQLLLRASHPPAAATTLLVTLGGLQPSLAALASFAGGVLAVVIVGEIARRLRAG